MQEPEVKALVETGTFPDNTRRRILEETHISWVILSGRFAFKIKKPLKLPFLDFSTLAKRKKYCAKEVRLNRRFSDIYLGVETVRSEGGRWRIGNGRGKIADYAVKMKRMQSSKRMDALLSSGKVTAEQVRMLARAIAFFHNAAEPVAAPFDPLFARNSFNDIAIAQRSVKDALPSRYSAIIGRAIAWSNVFIQRHKTRLQERVMRGYRRDLHGDLHCANIFLYQKPVIFDCVEFNDTYRQTDVIDEVAFLCMDLEAFGERRLARIFIERYKELFHCIETDEDMELFVYYKCYRANIRAKVHALRARQTNDPKAKRKQLRAVKKYLVLMEAYMGSK